MVFTIGIDPHKGSHLAAVLDEHEQFHAELRVRADRHQRERLLKFAGLHRTRIAVGNPWAESFNGRARDELLSGSACSLRGSREAS